MQEGIKKNNTSTYVTVLTFLTLEILAFVSFSLFNSFITYSILGLILVVLFVLTLFKRRNNDLIFSSLFYIFPLVIYGLLTSISNFMVGNVISLTTRIFIPLGFLAFASLGALLSSIKEFKLSTLFLVIYGALAILVVINLFITMIQFSPFYTMLHPNGYIYYDGKKSTNQLGSLAYSIIGFKIELTSVNYFSFFPSLLFSSAIALFFINPKKDKTKFLLYCLFTFIALLSLIFVPNKFTLVSLFITVFCGLVILLFFKFKPSEKVIRNCLIVIFILFFIFLLLFFINSQGGSNGLTSFIANNALLNRVFNTNRFSTRYKKILNGLFTSEKIFGFPLGYYSVHSTDAAIFTNNFFIDNLMTSGVFGEIFFLVSLFFGLYGLYKFVRYGEEKKINKALLTMFIFTFFIYCIINYDCDPIEFSSSTYMPVFTNSQFLIVICLLGYCYMKGVLIKTKKTSSSNVESNDLKIDTLIEE